MGSIVFAIGLVLLLAGCAPASRPTPSTVRVFALPEAPPTSVPVAIGTPHLFELYTHCGIHWAYFDGRWWQADPPLDDGSRNPPPGWRNPSAYGTMELVTQDRALFRGYGDLTAEFRALLRTVQKDPSEPCY